jgi:tRNA A-37 threonylcarbamoyl transferase component Bud32
MRLVHAPWWMYVVAASLLAFFAFTIYADVFAPEFSGILAADDAGRNVRLVTIERGSPLERAGLQPGDRIVAADGDAITSLDDWRRHAALFHVDRAVELEIDRAGARVRATMVPRRDPWMSRTTTVARVNHFGWRLMMLSFILISFVVFWRPYDLTTRLFWITVSAMGTDPSITHPSIGWAALWRGLPGPLAAFLALPILTWSGVALAAFGFCSVFPREYFASRRRLLAWCAPGLVLLPFQFAGFCPLFEAAPGLWATRIMIGSRFSYIPAGLVVLALNYRRLQDQNQRRRVHALIPFAALSAIVIPHAAVTVAWRTWFQSDPPLFFSYAALAVDALLFEVLLLMIVYAILKHRIFGFGLIVRRGIQYALARRVVVSLLPAAVALLLIDVALSRGDVGVGAVVDLLTHSRRGWIYAAMAVLALVARRNRQTWLDALDRRFFRERYDAQQILRQTVEEIRASRGLADAGPRIVSRIDAALHPEFVALMTREPNAPSYACETSAPPGLALPALAADSKLIAVFRLFGKPLQISLSESGWLKQQLPHAETNFLRNARIDLLVPVSLSPAGREALFALGQKKSEEPYSSEDEQLLLAIANALGLLLERPAAVTPATGVDECPQCGRCYDSGTSRCADDGAALTASTVPRFIVGRYRLDRRLGRGGMGTAYSALDTSLDRQVALKLIREDIVASADAAERFRREARAAAAITHPNVVTIHDFNVDAERRAFLVMELLAGATLRQHLRQTGRLPPERTVRIVRGVCSALSVAHQRGLIHRDLKPENIFLTRDGDVPKVLDFGVAKFVAASDTATKATMMETGVDVLVGTPRYMSPEQLGGQPVAPQWDLWSLTVIAYEMLCGAYPFGDPSSIAAVHAAILSGRFTPVDRHVPDAPATWQQFFAVALASRQSRRPGSAEELASAFTAHSI